MPEVISKQSTNFVCRPNLADYDTLRTRFSWEQARRDLDGLPGDRGLNIAHEAVDRHAVDAHRDKIAIRWLGLDGSVRDLTFHDLARGSNRFANVLRRLGVDAGDRVYALTGRIPELYFAALGAWKAKAVLCTLFAAFGPEPIRARMAIGEARVLVTTEALYRKKIASIRDQLPSLEHVLVVGSPGLPGTRDLARLMAAAVDTFEIPPTDPEDMALLHFTSGTTGTPKGAVHVHGAVLAHHATGKLALDLHPTTCSGALPTRAG